MRGLLFYHHRKRRLVAVGLLMALLYMVVLRQPAWVKGTIESKVADFLGNRLTVKVGNFSGGIFRNVVLQDVAFISGRVEDGKVFRLDRMEVSYRLWWVLLDRIDFLPKTSGRALRFIKLYFNEKNPFLRGFIELYRRPGNIEFIGYISPVLFGQADKKGLKGIFVKQPDGKYSCEVLWDGKIEMVGVLDPDNKTFDV